MRGAGCQARRGPCVAADDTHVRHAVPPLVRGRACTCVASASLPAVLALAPHSGVGAHAGTPEVAAVAPLALMLADARAPAVLADAPLAVMRADTHAPAVLALLPAECSTSVEYIKQLERNTETQLAGLH